MEKYSFNSSLHNNQEMVVYLEEDRHDELKKMAANEGHNLKKLLDVKEKWYWQKKYYGESEGSVIKQYFYMVELLRATRVEFTQKEALDRLRQEKDKLELGLISQEEYEKRKLTWAKYIR